MYLVIGIATGPATAWNTDGKRREGVLRNAEQWFAASITLKFVDGDL